MVLEPCGSLPDWESEGPQRLQTPFQKTQHKEG